MSALSQLRRPAAPRVKEPVGDRLALAVHHHEAGNASKAASLCRQILRREPRHAEALLLMGRMAAAAGKPERAAQLFAKVATAPTAATTRLRLGVALREIGRPEEALAHFEAASRLEPDSPDPHACRGNALKALGRHAESVAAHERAIALEPESPAFWSNLGLAYKDWGRHGEAVESLERAAALAPGASELHYNLGNGLLAAGRIVEAETSFRAALLREPGHARAIVNLGTAQKEQGRLDEAIATFRGAVAARPEDANAHWNLALALLMTGDWTQGWREYEWRRRLPGFPVERLDGPEWDGAPLAGRTLLVHAEQGLGDAIQFARCARAIPRDCGRVVLRCQPRLARLLSSAEGIDAVAPSDERLSDHDLQVPLMSVPGRLGEAADSAPYLRPEPALARDWAARLGAAGNLRIGIGWQGNPNYEADRRRSVPLPAFAALTEVPDISLYALQKGPGREQIAGWPVEATLHDLGGDLDNGADAFVDTAAVLAGLDLVISSDTALPHLAGAMGVETWLVLPHLPDWRWGLEGETSHWYPSMRLFRQDGPGDWAGVFARVVQALRERVA